MRRTIGAAMIGGALLLSAASAQAATVVIQNADFSAGRAQAEGEVTAGHAGGNPTGWGASGGSSTGHWNPTAADFVHEAAHGGVGWTTGLGITNNSNPGMLAQTIAGHTIQANTRYTLTLDVGRWLGGNSGGQPWGFEIGLLGGLLDGTGVIFAQLNEAAAGGEFTPGMFRTVSMVFETGASDAFIGKQLSILLSGRNPGAAFDNVTLDASPLQTSAVPEPATWAMMITGFGLVGGAMRGSRRRAAVTA